MTMTLMTAVVAAAALQCPGSGFVEQKVEQPADKTMKTWVDAVGAKTDGFTATVTLDDAKPPRIMLPRKLVDLPGYAPMVVRTDDGDNLEMIRVMGVKTVKAEYNRLSGILVITVPEGRWVGRCERGIRR